MWLIYAGCKAVLGAEPPRVHSDHVGTRWINRWVCCDVCSRMLIPGNHSYGCRLCSGGGHSYYACQACLERNSVCRHVCLGTAALEENILQHRQCAPGALTQPRVFGDKLVFFECLQCYKLLPAGSVEGYCKQHLAENG